MHEWKCIWISSRLQGNMKGLCRKTLMKTCRTKGCTTCPSPTLKTPTPTLTSSLLQNGQTSVEHKRPLVKQKSNKDLNKKSITKLITVTLEIIVFADVNAESYDIYVVQLLQKSALVWSETTYDNHVSWRNFRDVPWIITLEVNCVFVCFTSGQKSLSVWPLQSCCYLATGEPSVP